MTDFEIGKACQCYRKKIGKTQREVAEDTHYSVENISAFENGRTNNFRILLWYVAHGLNVYNISVDTYPGIETR